MSEEVNGQYEPKKGEEKKEEKKENWFSKTFSKVKKGIEDTNREGKLENEYRKDALEFSVYTGGLLSNTYYGKLKDDNTAEVYGILTEENVPFSSVLEVEKDGKKNLYYISSIKHYDDDQVKLTIKEKVNDKEVDNTYSRPVSILTLDSNMQEVDVIKVHDKYYLKLKK